MGLPFDYRGVSSKEEFDAAILKGWFETMDQAFGLDSSNEPESVEKDRGSDASFTKEPPSIDTADTMEPKRRGRPPKRQDTDTPSAPETEA